MSLNNYNCKPLIPFHPLVKQWFFNTYSKATDIQNQSWPLISKNHHVLMTAPTGSGKTMAAFLWPINQLLTNSWSSGQVRVLYISPLKALNNDIKVNLLNPLKQLQEIFEKSGQKKTIQVQTRSGDTTPSERQRILRKPPEILIITPEGLNLMLSSKKARFIFSGIAMVIIDEIHAVASSKRGTHLITAVDRLVDLSGEFQRIGISATVRPLQLVADFIGGFKMIGTGSDTVYEKRKVHIVQSSIKKQTQVKVCFPENARENMHNNSWWPALTSSFVDVIQKNRSTLLFCNSRRLTEKITRFINENSEEQLAYSHHGSLSKEMRLLVEKKLKNGELKAIVATSSLELGIDIGSLDEIILVQTPFQISAAIQRLGRAGHSIDDISRASIFPTHGRDFLNAAIMARAMIDADIEPLYIPICPLDILAQIIISMTGTEQWDIDELFYFLKSSYPFNSLKYKTFNLVLDMLAGRYADTKIRELNPKISIDRIDNTVHAKDGVLRTLYISGGTIPDRGYFDLRLKDTNAKIGELDEEFVWERSAGDIFVLGTQSWQIHNIDFQNVHVTHASKAGGMAPFWRAESMGRDFYFSEKIGNFLEKWNYTINNQDDNIALENELKKTYFLDSAAAEEFISFLKRQKQISRCDLPHRHHLLVEHFSDPLNQTGSKQIILHTLWGAKINQPFAIALSQSWEEEHGYPLHIFYDDDCIILNLPHNFSASDILDRVTPENLKILLRKKLEKTGLFGSRFRENAAIALLLPKKSFKKRMPLWLNRLRSKKLLDSVLGFEDFPVLAETWRTCFQDIFDIKNLNILLDEIRQGLITVSETITRVPSPFTSNVLWQQANKLMYEDDAPADPNVSSLRQDILNEILYNSELRPDIPNHIIQEFIQKVHRTFPKYSPTSIDDLLDLLKDRLVIPENEWIEVLESMNRDHGIEIKINKKSHELNKKIISLIFPQAQKTVFIALENLPLIQKSMKSIDKFINILESWIAYYGPVNNEFIKDVFGIEEQYLQSCIDQMITKQSIICGILTEGKSETELCDSRNMEILLRILRKENRPDFKALDIEYLPLFLAKWQGLVDSNRSQEDLQAILEQLMAYPCKAELWESDIFPSRLSVYYTEWLDSLVNNSELVWFGNDKKTLAFCFESELELYLNEEEPQNIEKYFPDPTARYRFSDLCDHSGISSKELTKVLWDLFFKGHVSTDNFTSIRKAIQTGFKAIEINQKPEKRRRGRRIGFNRWKSSRPILGNWFVINSNFFEPDDLMEKESIIKDQVRQLFDRYGILFRELLSAELPRLKWSNIFKSLRIMELSGEILSGCFFNNIQGIQFISHKAFRLLNEKLPENSIFWLNATDPISMCGIGPESLKKKLPARRITTHLVYHGNKLVLISKKKGKDLHFYCPPNDQYIKEYLSFFKKLLSRQFKPLPKIIVETINQKPVIDNEYRDVLIDFGFKEDYGTLVLKAFCLNT